jgi:tRNA A-37 threonylcarbamoyl transferase component Bud32
MNDIKRHNKKCKIYGKKNKNDYVILYSNYVKSKTLKEFLIDDIGVSYIKLVYYYNFILACIDFLQIYKVIHNDLHFSNTIFDENENKFYLIDFGLSIYNLQKKFDDPNYDIYYYLKKIFIKFDPEWKYQSIEMHICCYLLYENETITDSKLKEIIDIYYLSTKKIFELLFKNLVSYKDKVFFHYKNLLSNKNSHEIIRSFLLESMFTLDLYQTAYCVIDCMIKYDIELSTSFIELLKPSLHYDYNKRPSVKKQKKKLALISKNIVESRSKIKKDIFGKESTVSKKQSHM